jgi:GNAT superfamily N-acetyltransferase
MKSLFLAKIKPFIKREFPIIRYRYRIYDYFKKAKDFLYLKSMAIENARDLSTELTFPTNYKLKIETIKEAHRDLLTEFSKNNYNNNMYRNWIYYFYKNNYNGFVATLQGNIIGYIWCWSNNNGIKPPPEVLFHNIKMKKGDVYLFNFFIAPQYRGHGNAIEFMNRVLLELKNLGYIRAKGEHDGIYLPAAWLYRAVGYKDIRFFTVHIFFNRIAYVEKAIFLKNSSRHPDYPFEYRLLLSFRNLF